MNATAEVHGRPRPAAEFASLGNYRRARAQGAARRLKELLTPARAETTRILLEPWI